jgi:hypothetical protein
LLGTDLSIDISLEIYERRNKRIEASL